MDFIAEMNSWKNKIHRMTNLKQDNPLLSNILIQPKQN